MGPTTTPFRNYGPTYSQHTHAGEISSPAFLEVRQLFELSGLAANVRSFHLQNLHCFSDFHTFLEVRVIFFGGALHVEEYASIALPTRFLAVECGSTRHGGLASLREVCLV